MVTGSVESPDPQGPSTKLFLGGLPPGVTDEDLRQHFETFGKVDEAVVKQPQGTSLQSHFGFLWVRPAEAARQIIAQDHTIHCASGLSVTIPAPVLARSTPLSTAWHCPQPAGLRRAPPSLNHATGCCPDVGQPRPISRSCRAGRPCTLVFSTNPNPNPNPNLRNNKRSGANERTATRPSPAGALHPLSALPVRRTHPGVIYLALSPPAPCPAPALRLLVDDTEPPPPLLRPSQRTTRSRPRTRYLWAACRA